MFITEKGVAFKSMADCANAKTIYDRLIKKIEYLASINGTTRCFEVFDDDTPELKKTIKLIKELGFDVYTRKIQMSNNKVGLEIYWGEPKAGTKAESLYDLSKRTQAYLHVFTAMMNKAEKAAKNGSYDFTEPFKNRYEDITIDIQQFATWLKDKHLGFSNIIADTDNQIITIYWN